MFYRIVIQVTKYRTKTSCLNENAPQSLNRLRNQLRTQCMTITHTNIDPVSLQINLKTKRTVTPPFKIQYRLNETNCMPYLSNRNELSICELSFNIAWYHRFLYLLRMRTKQTLICIDLPSNYMFTNNRYNHDDIYS